MTVWGWTTAAEVDRTHLEEKGIAVGSLVLAEDLSDLPESDDIEDAFEGCVVYEETFTRRHSTSLSSACVTNCFSRTQDVFSNSLYYATPATATGLRVGSECLPLPQHERFPQ